MAIFGFVRRTLLKNEQQLEGQVAEMVRKAEELGGTIERILALSGSPEKKKSILGGPNGKQILETLQAGDTLIAHSLEHLGYSMSDVRKTLVTLSNHDVRILVLRSPLGELDLPPDSFKIFQQFFGVCAKTERAFRSERATAMAISRKERGLACGGVPFAKKVVVRNGEKVLKWDMEQLRYIAEIAKRLPKEGAAKVAQDFWKRRIKNRYGRLWGKQVPKPTSGIQQANRMLRCLLGRRSRSISPYQQFYRAARWFHRMKWKGLLPPPYGEWAETIPEPKSFRKEPKPRKWTRGGTQRRDQERAAAKARNRAKRLERWQKEKEVHLHSRVHKPKVERWLQTGEAQE